MSLWLFLNLLLFLSPVFCFVNVAEIKPCSEDCTLYQGKYLSSRMWTLQDKATFTTHDVSSTFERDLAPKLTKLKGFNEYVSSPLCGTDLNPDLNRLNSDVIISYDIFDTEEQGNASTVHELEFKNKGVLSYQIDPVMEFWGIGKIDFHIRRKDFCQSRSDKFYLSTYLWNIGSGMCSHEVTQEFLKTFVPIIKKHRGFIQYVGVERTDGKALFYGVFETEDQAVDANVLVAEYQASNSKLSGLIERYRAVSRIDFDFLCTSPQDSWDSKRCHSECKSFEGRRFGSRQWIKTQPQLLGYSNYRIVDELVSDVASIIAQADGFNSYNGIVLNDTDRAYFFNVFDTEVEADAAEEIEIYIQANGKLKTEICKDRFESGYYQFHIIHPRACVIVGEGAHIATHLWEFLSGCTYTAREVIEIFKREFAPLLSRQPGFLEFAGIVLDGGDNPGRPFFYSVFQSKEGAENSSRLAREFVANNATLSCQIECLEKEFGIIKEEYQCQYRKEICPEEIRPCVERSCYDRDCRKDYNRCGEPNINLHFGDKTYRN